MFAWAGERERHGAQESDEKRGEYLSLKKIKKRKPERDSEQSNPDATNHSLKSPWCL